MNNSTFINDSILSQFDASLDMLENAINMCPNKHWNTALDFWYLSYHCIFWTDYQQCTELGRSGRENHQINFINYRKTRFS